MDEKKIKSLFLLATDESQEKTNDDYKKVGAWFMGPKAENKEFFIELLQNSIQEHAELRETYYDDEQGYIDDAIKDSPQYKAMCALLRDKRELLSNRLKESVPFFSQKYQGHMCADTLMAGSLGYMTAILYNQNNVATEASPVTSLLEQEVGEQLCELLGFKKEKSWGHITADGTIANIEAMWAARNLKAHPLAIKEMLSADMSKLEKDIQEALKEVAKKLTVHVFDESKVIDKLLMECSSWQLLNIYIDEVFELPTKIKDICSLIDSDKLNELLKPHLLATKGIAYYAKHYSEFGNTKIFVPATHHYSWPKSGTLLGIGQENIVSIPVDEYCKMDIEKLKTALDNCIAEKQPVIMVVAVIGSTAEGAVDDLVAINGLKLELAQLGLQFNLHCDAAWGGYLRSMLIKPTPPVHRVAMVAKALPPESHPVPVLPLSYYAIEQFENLNLADTITIDPHKSGYIPYAAGALCYRNKQLRSLITFNAAYIQSDDDANMGIYGVEGSKPGATAAAVWLAHATVPLNCSGYGQILGECNYSAKLYYCNWITLQGEFCAEGSTDKYEFFISPLVQLPDSIGNLTSGIEPFLSRDDILAYIKKHVINQTIETIAANPRTMMLLQNVGTDVLMNAFIVNFSKNGDINTDYECINELNKKLFEKFSITKVDGKVEKPNYMLMMNTLSSNQYGKAFHHIEEAWGLKTAGNYDLKFLVNTILQPWPNTRDFINDVMEIFKEGVRSSLEAMIKEKRI